MTLTQKINDEIKEAIRSRDQIRLNTLRMLKAKIIAVDARCSLSDVEVVKLFKSYFGSLQEALKEAKAAGRQEMADQLEKEIAITQEFLPQALSVEETRKIVEQAIKESGATKKKDLGLVMKSLKQLSSAVDGKMAKDILDELLAD